MAIKRWMTAALVGAAALVPAGCTNSEVVTPGNATLEIRVVIANSQSRFDEAFFFIRQIVVVPTDALSSGALNEPLALLNPDDVVEVNANQAGVAFTVPANLGTGPWRVSLIRMDQFVYQDFDPPAAGAECNDYVARWAPTPESGADMTALGPDSQFTIEPGGTNILTITIDHAVFLEAFQSSFICLPQGVLGCQEDWCLALPGSPPVFNPAPLFLQAPQFLTFE